MHRPAGTGCDPVSFTIDPQTLAFTDLVPGRAQHHDVHVENLGPDAVSVSAHVDRTTGPLFAGSTPLDISVTTTAGLPAVVAPGERVDLTVAATLPTDAGNTYAGTDGEATIRLVATTRCTGAGSTSSDDALVLTGPAGALTVLLLAVGLVLTGTALRGRKETRP